MGEEVFSPPTPPPIIITIPKSTNNIKIQPIFNNDNQVNIPSEEPNSKKRSAPQSPENLNPIKAMRTDSPEKSLQDESAELDISDQSDSLQELVT